MTKTGFSKISRAFAAAGVAALLLTACEDELSSIGSSLTTTEVAIEVDSTFTVSGASVYAPVFDSRSTTNLIGRLSVPEYGDLHCTYVAQLLSASQMLIPDSIGVERVDSMKLILRVPRKSFTGDSIAPQQLRVYRLTKDLPSDINNAFDPTGYYEPSSLLGTRSYTLNALSMNDSIYTNSTYIDIQVPMPLALAREIFTKYREDDAVFQWPSTFTKWFKGIYVEPSFGRGCVANVTAANMVTYYNYKTLRTVSEDEESVQKEVLIKDSVTLMATAPEVLSSNNVSLKVADDIKARVQAGEVILMSPAGYNVGLTFPVQQILDKYYTDDFSMAIVNDLTFTLAAKPITNDYGITLPPQLLLIKTSELDSFFAQNKLPDNISSFYAEYNSSKGTYSFSSMKSYLTGIMEGGELDPADTEFTLVPVSVTTTTDSYYGTTSITGCTPYFAKPTMGVIDLENSQLKFTYSKQVIN